MQAQWLRCSHVHLASQTTAKQLTMLQHDLHMFSPKIFMTLARMKIHILTSLTSLASFQTLSGQHDGVTLACRNNDPASQKLAAINSTLNFACSLKHAHISIHFLTNCTTKSSQMWQCRRVYSLYQHNVHDSVNEFNRPDTACKDSRTLTVLRVVRFHARIVHGDCS